MNRFRQVVGVTVLGILLYVFYAIVIEEKTIEEAFFPDNRSAVEIAEAARIHMMSNPFSMKARSEAENLLKRAYKRDKNEPLVYVGISQLALIHGYKVGNWFDFQSFEEESLKQAYQYAWSGVQFNPNHALANAHLGKIFIVYQQYDKAQQYLDIAKGLEPNLFETYYYLSRLKLKQSEYSDSLKYIGLASQLASSGRHEALVRDTKKEIAKSNSDFALAETYYLEEIRINPNSPYAHGNYGAFLLCMGRLDESIEELNKAISLGEYPHAVNNLKSALNMKNEKQGGHSSTVSNCRKKASSEQS